MASTSSVTFPASMLRDSINDSVATPIGAFSPEELSTRRTLACRQLLQHCPGVTPEPRGTRPLVPFPAKADDGLFEGPQVAVHGVLSVQQNLLAL